MSGRNEFPSLLPLLVKPLQPLVAATVRVLLLRIPPRWRRIPYTYPQHRLSERDSDRLKQLFVLAKGGLPRSQTRNRLSATNKVSANLSIAALAFCAGIDRAPARLRRLLVLAKGGLPRSQPRNRLSATNKVSANLSIAALAFCAGID